MWNNETDALLWNAKPTTSTIWCWILKHHACPTTRPLGHWWARSELIRNEWSLLTVYYSPFLGNPICILAATQNTSARKLKQLSDDNKMLVKHWGIDSLGPTHFFIDFSNVLYHREIKHRRTEVSVDFDSKKGHLSEANLFFDNLCVVMYECMITNICYI